MAKFLQLTDKCNCSCSFCYQITTDGSPHEYVGQRAELVRQMRQAMDDEGWRDIILTGGEPTMMPTYLPLLGDAKRMGFEMVGTATNGRRFAYEPFARRAVLAGLNRVWVSLFGDTAKIHDACTRTPKSFEQTSAGIRNLVALGLDVTCSIVVCKLNHQRLVEYFDYVESLGVKKVQMMGIKPFGGAFLHQRAVFYDIPKGAPYVNIGMRYGVSRGFDIVTMGLPAPYYDTNGTTDDNNRAVKYFDYVLKTLGGRPYCKGPLCDSCFGRNVCPESAPPGELIVCKCYGINERTLRQAISSGSLKTVEAVAERTGAGKGCETCREDLRLLLRSELEGVAFEPFRELRPGPSRHGKSMTEPLAAAALELDVESAEPA